jgi:hypothetical protein
MLVGGTVGLEWSGAKDLALGPEPHPDLKDLIRPDLISVAAASQFAERRVIDPSPRGRRSCVIGVDWRSRAHPCFGRTSR